jgi:hypothetical protein
MVVLRGVSYCYMYSAAHVSKVSSQRKRWQAIRDKGSTICSWPKDASIIDCMLVKCIF